MARGSTPANGHRLRRRPARLSRGAIAELSLRPRLVHMIDRYEQMSLTVRSTVTSTALSRDGADLLIAYTDGVQSVYKTARGEKTTLFHNVASGGAIWRGCFSPDGTLIASAGQDGSVSLHRVVGDRLELVRRHAPGEPVYCCTFSPDGQLLLAGGADGKWWLWDTAKGAERVAVREVDGAVFDCAISSDNELFAFALDRTLLLYQYGYGHRSVLHLDEDGFAAARQCKFSPDGTLIAAACTDGRLRLWSTVGGEPAVFGDERSLKGPLTCCAFTPDGRLIATGENDGTVTLWQVSDGKVAAQLDSGSAVQDCAIANGLLAVGGERGRTALYRLR